MPLSPHLIRAVRESRIDISREYQGLLGELDLQKKLSNSVKHHPLRWMAGAVTAGLLTTFFGVRRSGVVAKAPEQTTTFPANAGNIPFTKIGWLTGALEIGRLLYPVLRPVVMELANNAVQNGLAKKRL